MLRAWPRLLWASHSCYEHQASVTSVTSSYKRDHSCATWLHKIARAQCLSSYGFPSNNVCYCCNKAVITATTYVIAARRAKLLAIFCVLAQISNFSVSNFSWRKNFSWLLHYCTWQNTSTPKKQIRVHTYTYMSTSPVYMLFLQILSKNECTKVINAWWGQVRYILEVVMHNYLSKGNISGTEIGISRMTCSHSKAPKWGEIFSNHDNNYCGAAM